jgi:predicted transcriptional regulator
MAMKRYRCTDDIFAVILRLCSKHGLKKTRIMYGALLSYGQVKLHVPALCQKGFLMQVDALYTTTARGREWLYHFDMMRAQEVENFHEETGVADDRSARC